MEGEVRWQFCAAFSMIWGDWLRRPREGEVLEIGGDD